MNTKKLIAAVTVFVAAGSAFAGANSEFTDFVNIPSTQTRAEVVADMSQARAAGSYVVGGEEVSYPGNQYAGSTGNPQNTALASTGTKTRAEVVAELRQARANGSYVVGGEEFVAPFATAKNGRTREAVRNEAVAAQRTNSAASQESGK